MLLEEIYIINDRIMLGFVVIAGWSFILISLTDEEDTDIINVILFGYARIAVIAGTIYLLYSWFLR